MMCNKITKEIHVFLIITWLFTNTSAESHRIFTRHLYNQARKHDINNAEDISACVNHVCNKISDFSISETNKINCFKENLAISFSIPDFLNRNKTKTSGFLKPSGIYNSISNSQKITKVCKTIKRYYKLITINVRFLII